jgi:hypothetical protein
MNATRLLTLVVLGSAAISALFLGNAYAKATASDSHSVEIVTREIPWDGSSTLSLGVRANVVYTQAPGAARLIARGPHRSVSTLQIANGHVHDKLLHSGSSLEITIFAPAINRFELNGRSSLRIENYAQEALTILTEGRGRVDAAGSARRVVVRMQGHSAVNLAQLATDTIEGDVGGFADLVVAPMSAAVLDVRSSASVILLTKPPKLETNLVDAGRVIHAAAR